MMNIPLPELIARLVEKSGMSEADIMKKIDEKCQSLSGLISKEGAAHIIGNELGVKFSEVGKKIKNLFPGMRNAEVLGRVLQVYEVREFSRADGSKSKVGSFMVGDDTGSIRMVCWGDKADLLKSLSIGSGVRISAGQVRDNQRGFKEVHLSNESKIVEAADAPGVKTSSPSERKEIKALQENDLAEVMGTVVQVFEPKFFEVCGSCGKRAQEQSGSWSCGAHSSPSPDFSYVMNVFLDDGSDSMRVVLFRDQVEQLLGRSRSDVLALRESPGNFESAKTALLGEQFVFSGRVKRNAFFDRLEFNANTVKPASAETELSRLG